MKVYEWFEERLEISAIQEDITSKYVPPHVNIFYCLGGIVFTSFLVQVATGFAMTFYYRPTVTEAFASVQYIMTEVNFGWLIRSIHRWSASPLKAPFKFKFFNDRVRFSIFFCLSFSSSLLKEKEKKLKKLTFMVLSLLLHIFRVYLTGGFKKPRELTWVSGVILAVCTVSFGVTGYSLPMDQVGYTPDAIPIVGDQIVALLRGGASVGAASLTRYYSIHTFVLPLVTAVFMLAHFLFIRKQGISGPL
uniref:cytochrome b6 n=1 Tax=Trentepohlia sp. BN17 TaxID=3063876 RepID=UPI001EDF70AF|nr:cytochrome b6 [Trentepohlia sp. BN17]UIB38738.1 cytochrome b6 [Trentepohlia sp. BN17]